MHSVADFYSNLAEQGAAPAPLVYLGYQIGVGGQISSESPIVLLNGEALRTPFTHLKGLE